MWDDELIKAVSQPICKLIEAVSGAIGIAYEPRHIRKITEAKKEEINIIAETIRNNSDIPIVYNSNGIIIDNSNYDEITRRAERAGKRLAYQELIKQENIESVIDSAYIELQDVSSVSNEPIDNDWMLRFMNSIEDISNPDMQKVWSKILEGEIIKPRSFSLRTLNVLKNLSQNEALLFQRICNYVINEDYIYANNEILEKYSITFQDLSLLEECGLINFSLGINKVFRLKDIPEIVIKSEKYILTVKKIGENFEGSLGLENYPLTEPGKELYKIIEKKLCEEYFLDVANDFKNQNQNQNVIIALDNII